MASFSRFLISITKLLFKKILPDNLPSWTYECAHFSYLLTLYTIILRYLFIGTMESSISLCQRQPFATKIPSILLQHEAIVSLFSLCLPSYRPHSPALFAARFHFVARLWLYKQKGMCHLWNLALKHWMPISPCFVFPCRSPETWVSLWQCVWELQNYKMGENGISEQ